MRRQYAGGAKPTTLSSNLGGSTADLTINCNDLSNYPDGSVGPFYIVIDRGTVSEEKILCATRTGNTISVYNSGLTNGRGADGTTITSHNSGATVEHVFTAVDANDANLHVNSSSGIHGLSGAVVGTTDSQTLTNKTLTSPVINTADINSPDIDGGTIDTATITGGTHTSATQISVTGSQALNSFRTRNTYVSTSEPTSGDGSDGDMWVVYQA